MTTLFGYNDIFLQHRTGEHPERPARLISIIETLKRDELWSELLPVACSIEPGEWITTNHSKEYVSRFKQSCEEGMPFIDSHECVICPDTYAAATKAVSMVLHACDLIVKGEAANGFCAVRPPGHHAEYDRSMGFCFFNNIAVAARYLQQQHGLKKILIFDWDVHHGNGTQNSFYRDGTVFYGSIHQHPATLFPGTGWPHEFGDGPGRGATLNMPLEPGGGDEEVLEAFKCNFLPVAREFNPDFILISAGFDAHRKDPLSQMNMQEEGFDVLTREMLQLAEQCCKGRLLSILEGGYHLGALRTCVFNHVKLLTGEKST